MSPDLAISFKRVGIDSGGPPPSAPTITNQPDDTTTSEGATVTLSVTATGTAPLVYQWYEGASGDTSTPVGSNSSSFTTPTLSVDVQYWVRVSNAVGSDDSVTADITVNPVPEAVLGIPNYLGFFRFPAGHYREVARRGTGSCTGRQVGGQTRIFVTGQVNTDGGVEWLGPVIEVIDPGTYGTNIFTAPVAALAGYWTADGYAPHRQTWRPAGSSITDPPVEPLIPLGNPNNGGLYWHEGNQCLYLAYVDTYNVSGYRDWAFCAITLSDLSTSTDPNGWGTTTGYGPWRFHCTDADGFHLYGPHRASLIFPHPTTGRMMTCGSLGAGGNVSGSWGPAVFGDPEWIPLSTPSAKDAPDIELPRRLMNYYYMGGKIHRDTGLLVAPNVLRSFRRRVNPTIYEPNPEPTTILNVNGQTYTDVSGVTGSWMETDVVGGAHWIQGPTKHGLIFCGVTAGDPSQNPADPLASHEFYGNNLNNWTCTHGFVYSEQWPTRTPPATGPNAWQAFPFLMCYDPADILAVEGTSNDYTPEPVWFINLETQFPGFLTNETGAHQGDSISGFYYEPTSRKLYCVAWATDRSTVNLGPVIHVFQWDET